MSFRWKPRLHKIDPDEILLDAENLPHFDTSQMEGRLGRPISKITLVFFGMAAFTILILFGGRLYALQVKEGERYKAISETHRLEREMIFANRGVITDRNGKLLAWNEVGLGDFARRRYVNEPGFAHLLGYVSYPKKDKQGIYYDTLISGRSGVERSFDHLLAGANGLKLTETNALGEITSESELLSPGDGKELRLSIDGRVQKKFFELIKERALAAPFVGGAGVILDVESGEVLAITSYPEYDPDILSKGSNVSKIRSYFEDKKTPLLNRALSGLYTPGSIVKPYVAVGALEEGVITPDKKILSTGSISVPNPYDPKRPSVFKDWREQGLMDMRLALAYSSNVYFFEVGGGFEEQKGLGIDRINKYMNLFGLGEATLIDLTPEVEEIGVVPNPSWKEGVYPGDPWRIGDTYNTSIGQYGFLVTPIQMAKAVAALASGQLLTPTVVKKNEKDVGNKIPLSVSEESLRVVREGLRAVVVEPRGTGTALNIPGLKVAAKSGTAEIGSTKATVNSWITGFFPYENPRYAFAVVMEKGSRENLVGATFVMRNLLEWMVAETPGYVKAGGS